MTQSTARTVVVPTAQPSQPYSASSVVPIYFWPRITPDSLLDYYADITLPLQDVGDTISSVSVSARPSGTGELSIVSVSVSGEVVGPIMLTGGVPGRLYEVKIDTYTAQGLVFCSVIGVFGDPSLILSQPLPTPPSPFFGTPVTWSSGGLPIYGLLGADGAYLLGADGAYLTYQ